MFFFLCAIAIKLNFYIEVKGKITTNFFFKQKIQQGYRQSSQNKINTLIFQVLLASEILQFLVLNFSKTIKMINFLPIICTDTTQTKHYFQTMTPKIRILTKVLIFLKHKCITAIFKTIHNKNGKNSSNFLFIRNLPFNNHPVRF